MAIYVSGFTCELILKEERIYSAIRIVDRITVGVPAGIEIPRSLPAKVMALLQIRSEEDTELTVSITVSDPTGKTFIAKEAHQSRIKAGIGGASIELVTNVNAGLEGLWWINVLVNGNLALRMPIEIRHSSKEQGLSESPSSFAEYPAPE